MKRTIEAIRKYDPTRQIAIETNGTIDFDDTIFDVVVVSPKSMSVVELWSHRPNVYVKFLASDENDIENIRRRLGVHIFANIPYVMPIGVTPEGIIGTSKVLSELIVSSGMNIAFSPRLHILMGVK
jgi:organic radical activating enzyme